MAANYITIHVKPRWWLRLYVRGLILMHWLTGMGVNEQRVAYWMRKGISVRAVR